MANVLGTRVMFTLTSSLRIRNCVGNGVVRVCNSALGARSSSSLKYCLNLVRQMDNENYMCTLLLPPRVIETAFALRAFNIELSRVLEQATEKSTLNMRYQFWLDCVNKIYENKSVEHPVVVELHKAVQRHKLPKLILKKLVTARLQQLDNSTFKNMEDMVKYADLTTTPIYLLLLEASGVKRVECDHVAFHLGVAQGLTNLVRGLQQNISERLLLIPVSLLIECKVSEEGIYQKGIDEETLFIISDKINGVAQLHLNLAQSMKKNIPYKCRTLFLPSVSVASYLDRFYRRNVWAPEGLHKLSLGVKLYWNRVVMDY